MFLPQLRRFVRLKVYLFLSEQVVVSDQYIETIVKAILHSSTITKKGLKDALEKYQTHVTDEMINEAYLDLETFIRMPPT